LTVAIAAPRLVPREVPDWHDAGLCRAFPELSWVHPGAADAFFLARKSTREAAELACRLICSVCPVRVECAVGALERGERWGIWGGLDYRDRKLVAAQFGFPPPGDPPEHGTNSRRVKWGCTCQPCKDAHALYEVQRRARARARVRLVAVVLARPTLRLDLDAYHRRYRRRSGRRR